MKQALGLVEIAGLCIAVAAADAMVKAANVELVELEPAKGGGYMTIKVVGNVGAVNAAVMAGCQIGKEHQKLVAWKVIPRPSDFVEDTFVIHKAEEPKEPDPDPTPEPPVKTPDLRQHRKKSRRKLWWRHRRKHLSRRTRIPQKIRSQRTSVQKMSLHRRKRRCRKLRTNRRIHRQLQHRNGLPGEHPEKNKR